MSLFKNGVGRPSNDTLKKRKIAYIAIAVAVVVLVGIGGYFVYSFSRGDLTTKNKNLSVNGLKVTVKAYKANSNGVKTGSVLKTVTDKNLEFTNWVNHKYKIVISAKTDAGTIKKIKWQITPGNKTTYNSANASWGAGDSVTYTYKSSSVTKELGINADGVRLGRIIVTDSNGRKRDLRVRFNIDTKAPEAKIAWKDYRAAGVGRLYTGTTGTVSCSDSMSGVLEVLSQRSYDKNPYSVPNNRTITVTMDKLGSDRYFRGWCVDKAGNKSSVKTSTKYKYVSGFSITEVKGNPTSWTNKNVTLEIKAASSNGLASKAYSFDNGKTWQSSNKKSFTKNQVVKIRVKDAKGKIEKANINITKIDKTDPTIGIIHNKNEGKATVSCSDSQSGVYYSYAFVVSGRRTSRFYKNPVKSTKYSLDTEFVGNNDTHITAVCQDAVGNEKTFKVKK